jgi:TIR domain
LTDYLYDIFISYERDSLTYGWIKEHFLPHLRSWLRNTVPEICSRPAQPIFLDRSLIDPDFPDDLKLDVKGIPPGTNWQVGMRDGLRFSRCLIGIWNPPYFASNPCTFEWKSFERRAAKTGSNVIIPTRFYDGKCFPEAARNLESIDLQPYTLFGPALIQSKLYEQFQVTMKLLALRAAHAISGSPAFEHWELAEDTPPTQPPASPGLPRFANAG